MKLDNHIANRFLTDEEFWWEMISTQIPGWEKLSKDEPKYMAVVSMYSDIRNTGSKNYYITETVLDKLDMLKVSRKSSSSGNGHFDWTYFKNVPEGKLTFILPYNCAIRVNVSRDYFQFVHLEFTLDKNDPKANYGHLYWIMFAVDTKTGHKRVNNNQDDVDRIEELIYKLLCFFYLSENEEIIVKPGQKHGTRKQGKLINILPFPITIVNSKWNVTSIRTEGFSVSGHFAIRWTGSGRQVAKMVFINPYEKQGYVRKASNERHLPKE